MKRLVSTKAIFEARLTTLKALLIKTDSHIRTDIADLNKLGGSLKRSTREKTINRIAGELDIHAHALGYSLPAKYNRMLLLKKVDQLTRSLSIMRYAAVHASIINLCVTYEEFIRRVLLKYYEEDIRRLKSNKETLKNFEIVDSIIRGDNLHRTLAEKIVDIPMYAGIDEWYRALNSIGINIQPSPMIKELFLVRNCIVHNDRKVSRQLHQHDPEKYWLRSKIKLYVTNFDRFKDQVHHSITFIISEYSRLYPEPGTSWTESDDITLDANKNIK